MITLEVLAARSTFLTHKDDNDEPELPVSVLFTAPAYANDLRLVMSAHSAVEHNHHQLTYTTPFRETRVLSWLTKADAHRRAKVLKARGYRVAVATMAD